VSVIPIYRKDRTVWYRHEQPTPEPMPKPVAATEKRCTKCGVVRPLCDFYKRAARAGRKESYSGACCDCYHKKVVQYVDRRGEIVNGEQTYRCAYCRKYQPKSQFAENRRMACGLDSWCKPCKARLARKFRREQKTRDRKRLKELQTVAA